MSESPELQQAIDWALNQNYQSVAARYAKTIAEAYVERQKEANHET